MHTLTVLYGQPTDPDAFRRHYQEVHLPLARSLPGVREVRYSLHLDAAAGDSPYVAIFEADFDDEQAMGAALAAPQGLAAQADVPNFATGGVTILHFAPVR